MEKGIRFVCYSINFFSLLSGLAVTFSSSVFAETIDPGESITLAMGSFSFSSAEQLDGSIIVEQFTATGELLGRATWDFDGTILGEPSLLVELVALDGTPFSLNSLLDDPPSLLSLSGAFRAGRENHRHFLLSWVWLFGFGPAEAEITVNRELGEIFVNSELIATREIRNGDTAFQVVTNSTSSALTLVNVPEPSSLFLLSTGILGLVGYALRQRQS